MTEQKYVDMEGMQKRVDAAHKEHLDKVWEGVNRKSEQVIKRNHEVQVLMGKAIQQEINDKEKELIAEMEAEKARAIKEIEEKHERNNINLQVAKQMDDDADLIEMLRNIKNR